MKRHKSNASWGESRQRKESGETSTLSRSTPCNLQPGPSKMPKIQLKIKRCRLPGAGNKTARTSTSPRKAGRHRRPSTASSGPSDGSGHQPRMSGQRGVTVIVPNDADSLREGPIERRLTWKEPTQLLLTAYQPTPGSAHLGQSVCGH